MKRSSLVLSAILIFTFFSSFFVRAQNVFINEFSQGVAGGCDWIELIVAANSTNVKGVYIQTTLTGAPYTGNKVQLNKYNAKFASLPKGTIIVIYKAGSSGPDTYLLSKYSSPDTSFTGDNRIVIPFDDTNIDTTEFAPTSAWPSFPSAGTNIGLFSSTGTGLFGLGYGTAAVTTDKSTFTVFGKAVVGAVTDAHSVHFTGDNTAGNGLPSDSTKWTIVPYNDVTCTPGLLNGGANNNLPVELTSFSASVVNGTSVNLTWKTATEVNNYGFDVERSSGNSGWQKIGFVAGSGNSNSPKNYSFTDNPSGGTSFIYRLKQIDVNGSFQYYDPVTVNLTVSSEPQLLQNSPNPFNPSTTIKFYIPNNSDVSIRIYDMLGREVNTLINEQTTAGYHIVYWNGKDGRGQDVASGVYLYRLTAGNFSETKKMNLLK